jgi:cysteine desulfurase
MANPSSKHELGLACRAKLEEFRSRAAEYFGCRNEAIVFNGGASEGNSHALFGAAQLLQRKGSRNLRIGLSAIEHESVVHAAKLLERLGHQLFFIPVDSNGVTILEEIERNLRDEQLDILSLMAVNNEIGTQQPVGASTVLCAKYGCLLHTDAVRAVGHGLNNIEHDPRIPLLTCTGHKFGGPRGVGILMQRGPWLMLPPEDRLLSLPQHICGGPQEQGARAGTENLAGIAGLVTALELCSLDECKRIEDLRRSMEERLLSRWPKALIHGAGAQRATHITSISFPAEYTGNMSGAKLSAILSERNIAVGSGSACHSGEDGIASSPTLAAMGVSAEAAYCTLRISLGWSSEQAHVEELLSVLPYILSS